MASMTGGRGRPKESDRRKHLLGNPGKRPLAGDAAVLDQPVKEQPPAPGFLSPLAKRWYNRTATLLFAIKELDEKDTDALAFAAHAYAEMRHFQAYRKKAITTKAPFTDEKRFKQAYAHNRHGEIVADATLANLRRASEEYRAWCLYLGISAQQRRQLARAADLQTADADNPFPAQSPPPPSDLPAPKLVTKNGEKIKETAKAG